MNGDVFVEDVIKEHPELPQPRTDPSPSEAAHENEPRLVVPSCHLYDR